MRKFRNANVKRPMGVFIQRPAPRLPRNCRWLIIFTRIIIPAPPAGNPLFHCKLTVSPPAKFKIIPIIMNYHGPGSATRAVRFGTASRVGSPARIAEQQDFVDWWGKTVGVRHGGDTKNADLRSCLSVEDAESQTGISQQTASRWRASLSPGRRIAVASPAIPPLCRRYSWRLPAIGNRRPAPGGQRNPWLQPTTHKQG